MVEGCDRFDPWALVYEQFGLRNSDQPAALRAWLPSVRPGDGAILHVGVGSAWVEEVILESLPDIHVWGLEPGPSRRAVALSRIAEHPAWFDRVTVRPEDFFSASLPHQLAGAVLFDGLGGFDAGERAAVLAELAARLSPNGTALLDMARHERPHRVEPCEFTAATVGEITYRVIVEASPMGTEAVRWRMCYLSLERERVLTEETAEYVVHHPTPERVADEAARVGLGMSASHGLWLLRHGS